MIVRRWRAVADDERGYVAHFHRRVLPALRSISGFEGALILRRCTPDTLVEIEVLTFWRSMNSIRRFAGDKVERAVVDNEARAVLRSFERRVRHLEVVLDTWQLSPINRK